MSKTRRIVCPGCGMTTWDENFGCALPGCENHGVLAKDKPREQPAMSTLTFTIDETTRIIVGMWRDHLRSEPNRADYPTESGSAQNLYWTRYDTWEREAGGLILLAGTRLLGAAVEALDRTDRP